ncbi:FAD/NAD(P)-binding domain-containing protein [Mytilinidion resinicola]|uniref:FAD/NAD(P)-binding domain-containing protein n=1 Tax=Mytilinidion resinicola TaxID=574789 RepID=A0A6A6Z2L8_9PEZI|nr:FAD/NAD(P)-binding domain-containing protein [Mytilinidion resinicola]KAF2815361.1 FAD/NAD(P)-binding domain-containing protein [Mytilinidion resinicola]
MASNIKRVAVIGAGPAGAITIDALTEEKTFDVIRVFERREKAGGIWIEDNNNQPRIPSLRALIDQTADQPIPVPETFPALTTQEEKINGREYRYTYTPVYPGMISNIDGRIMAFSKEKFPKNQEPDANGVIDPDAAFHKSEIIRGWVENLIDRNGYRQLVEYNTSVEKAEKVGKEWVLTLRKALPGGKHNYWWQETFDALVVASGHYSIPRFSEVKGLAEFSENHPGVVEHSKIYRGPERYRGKTVVTIGASVSATDIARQIAAVAKSPVYSSIREPHRVYGTVPFEHPQIALKPTISHVSTSPNSRTVYFSDGTKVDNVDHIIFGTGYDFSLPFLPSVKIANRRILGTYEHIFMQDDPTLSFVGGVSAGFTFLVFEWQAVAVARYLAGRAQLPSKEGQKEWEEDRLRKRGDGQPFFKVAPDFEEYFEALRKLAGEPAPGVPGRRLLKWDPAWLAIAEKTMQNRIQNWKDTAALVEKQLKGVESAKPADTYVERARL